MNSKHKFQAVCTRDEQTGSTGFIEVPFDVREVFGRARPPVHVEINGYNYRSTILVYGGKYYIPFNKANRFAAGAEVGEELTVVIRLDEEPRVVQIPEALKQAFTVYRFAAKNFNALSYSHQREYVDWINAAKQSETRERRIVKTIDKLR